MTRELHSKIRGISIKCNELVVGSSLEALIYCYMNDFPFVCSRLSPPSRFDFFEPDQDLTMFGPFANITRELTSPTSKKQVGADKLWLWERLFFYLSVSGLCPMGDRVSSLRIDGNTLKAITPNARMAKFHYENLIVFDEKEVYGLPATFKKTENAVYKVYDWINVRSGMKHQYDWLEDTTDFVKEILFYSTDRVDGNHDLKDAVAVSYLTKEQLDDFEYSDINARFKTLYMMKQAGIRGTRNGRDMKDKTKFKYYAVKVENEKREIIVPRDIYRSVGNITFNYDTFDDIINKNALQDSYVSGIIQRTN